MHEYKVIFTTGGETYTEDLFADNEEEVIEKVKNSSYPDVVISEITKIE